MSARAAIAPGRRRLCALLADGFSAGGGIAQYNRDLLSAAAADWDISILPRRAGGGASPPSVVEHAAPGGKLAYLAAAARLGAQCRPADVIFCGHLNLGPAALVAAARSGAALVVQAHGIEAWRRPGRLGRALLDRADLILSVSRHSRARLGAWTAGPPERRAVLPNTVADRFTPAPAGDDGAARWRAGLGAGRGPDNAHLLLSVGRLSAAERYKGQDRVIALLPSLDAALRRATGRGLVYAILGAGDDRARLEALAADRGAAALTRFVGAASAQILPQAYRAADLFVMPSTGEGFGIAYLEAMACGTPALGLAAGGAVDPLDIDAGAAVAPEALEAAIFRRLRAPEAGPRGERLSAAVQARFGRPAFARRARALLRRAAAAAPSLDALWTAGLAEETGADASAAIEEAAA